MNQSGQISRRKMLAAFPMVAAQPVQHQLHHIALAMVWRRHVCKDKQLHVRFGAWSGSEDGSDAAV